MTQPQPTQTQHPWRATVRTVAAVGVPLLLALPAIVDALGVGSVPWVAGLLAAAAGLTRMLAVPAVNEWLREYVPGLAAQPRDR
jgi:hypothetical protein